MDDFEAEPNFLQHQNSFQDVCFLLAGWQKIFSSAILFPERNIQKLVAQSTKVIENIIRWFKNYNLGP